MSLKTKIKNDMWQVNYVVPFVKKHQFDEKGKVDMLKHAAKAYSRIKAVKVHGKRTVGNDTKALLGTINIALDKDSHFVYFLDEGKTLAIPGNILSNFTLDYDKIIHGSFKDLTERAVGSDDYGTETKAVADGIETLRMRILESVKISNNVYKKSQIEYFENMFSRPAQHFDEALQRILFFNQIMWQTRHRLNGLGRLDLILGGLYAEDVRAGSLNYDSASTLVADFLSNLSKYPEYKSDALEGDIGQIIILGGNQPDGSYFCNELTEIFLKEQANLKKPDPKTFLRVGKNMPDSLLELAVSCLTAKTGSPLFSNDEAVVPALKDFGMPDEDAYSYCVSACWEPYIVGESLDQNNVMVFDYFKALNRVLSSGQEHASFDALVDAYIKENKKCFAEFLVDVDALKWAKDPLVSMFMDGCSEKRKDVSEGAAKYNNYGITTVALSNVVDSLCNIKKLVFEEKKHTLTEMNKARVEDFANAPELFAEITALQKSYGHDDVVVESLVNRITASVAEVAKDYRNALGGTVKFGLSSPGYNILSKKMPADFSGRKSGKPYNTHISCTDAGYTEIVGFAGKLGYDRQRFNGNVIDFFMTESLIEGNIDKFVLFMKGAIASGFFQMQMNLIDSKTLIDAKVHPEKYKGLMVRVWGFSAYFNELPEGYKDLLIERAVAAERVAGVVSEYERMPTKTMKRNANTKNTEGSMEKLKYRLKNNFAVRVALFPYMNHIRKSELERYSVSSDSNSIKLWKDKYKGKRCFIVGNGPSLKPEDLDELRNEYTFGANRIYEVFDKTDWRPTFYFAVDNSFIEAETDRLNALELQNLFLAADENIDISGIGHAVRIFEFTKFKINKWNDNSAHISKDVSKYFSVGYTVTFTEIQMAIYMGFTEIILLGVDFNYSSVRDRKGRIHTKEGVIDYFSGKKYESTVLPYYSNLCAYEAAKKYADEHKIKILNATRGGKLEVFDRINFDNIVFPADNVWGGIPAKFVVILQSRDENMEDGSMNKVKKISLQLEDYLKEIKWIRVLCIPYYRVVRKAQNNKYENSVDGKRIRKFKQAYHGQKCFIIGNGPSLKLDDLEKIARLKEIETFASNRIYNIFDKTFWRPDFYVAFEPYFVEETMDAIGQLEVAEAKFINKVGKPHIQEKNNNIYWLNCFSKFMPERHTTSNIEFSTDLSKYVADAYTVTFTALQLATYMGFSEIYLLGIDHFAQGKSFEHFYADKNTDYKTYTYVEGIEYGYRVAKTETEKRGIKVYNATRGGHLEVFDRVDFDEVVSKLDSERHYHHYRQNIREECNQ